MRSAKQRWSGGGKKGRKVSRAESTMFVGEVEGESGTRWARGYERENDQGVALYYRNWNWECMDLAFGI
jgi:hypothetical protein